MTKLAEYLTMVITFYILHGTDLLVIWKQFAAGQVWQDAPCTKYQDIRLDPCPYIPLSRPTADSPVILTPLARPSSVISKLSSSVSHYSKRLVWWVSPVNDFIWIIILLERQLLKLNHSICVCYHWPCLHCKSKLGLSSYYPAVGTLVTNYLQHGSYPPLSCHLISFIS